MALQAALSGVSKLGMAAAGKWLLTALMFLVATFVVIPLARAYVPGVASLTNKGAIVAGLVFALAAAAVIWYFTNPAVRAVASGVGLAGVVMAATPIVKPVLEGITSKAGAM